MRAIHKGVWLLIVIIVVVFLLIYGLLILSRNQSYQKVRSSILAQLSGYQLFVNVYGDGSVSSNDGLISNCTNSCVAFYQNPIEVVLTPTAGGTSAFSGWTGCNSVDENQKCHVIMDSHKNISVSLSNVSNYVFLTINKQGSGRGIFSFSATPNYLYCGPDINPCFAYYQFPQPSLVITANPQTGDVFEGWTSCCTGTNQCTINLNNSLGCSATFGTSGGSGANVSSGVARIDYSRETATGQQLTRTVSILQDRNDLSSQNTIRATNLSVFMFILKSKKLPRIDEVDKKIEEVIKLDNFTSQDFEQIYIWVENLLRESDAAFSTEYRSRFQIVRDEIDNLLANLERMRIRLTNIPTTPLITPQEAPSQEVAPIVEITPKVEPVTEKSKEPSIVDRVVAISKIFFPINVVNRFSETIQAQIRKLGAQERSFNTKKLLLTKYLIEVSQLKFRANQNLLKYRRQRAS